MCFFSDSIYLQWLELRYHYLALSPDIKSLLVKLRQHYLLGLITNGPSCAQWEKVERLDLQNYFDVILVSGDLPWEKPNCKIFHKACNYLGVEPSKCVMVGDSLQTDILGGIQAKLGYTIWVPLNDNCCLKDKDPCPDFTLDSVNDLVNLLPCNNKVPTFRSKSLGTIKNLAKLDRKILSLPDLDDYSSNSSDGS